jgi:hypothetical protein
MYNKAKQCYSPNRIYNIFEFSFVLIKSFFSKVIDEKLIKLPKLDPTQTISFDSSKFKVVIISSSVRKSEMGSS